MLLRNLNLVVRSLRGVTYIANAESFSNLQIKKYGRWAPRIPSAVVNEDELFDVNVQSANPTPKTRKVEKKSKQVQQKMDKKDSGQTLFTKLHDNSKTVGKIIMSIKSNKRRKKNEQILLEGSHFIQDAIEAGIPLESIIFSRSEDIKDLPIMKDKTKLYKVPYKSIQLWSTLTTPPGIMGIFTKPKPKKESKDSLPITVVCDNIRDPGNMGAILRTAAGVGCEKILLTKGCVDFWEPKVLRSAAGAHFRIPVYGSQEWDDIRSLISESARFYVADNKIDYAIEQVDNDNIGEGSLDDCTNVTNESLEQTSVRKKKSNKLKLMHNLTVVPYYAVNYTESEVVLIIGGETEGLSEECFTLVKERFGIRVNIPLSNSIDSLNAGIALGVISFEIKKQFLAIKEKIMALKQ